MKKAKVIVPALALLAVSTVASITGTVAWFTTATTAKVSFSQFSVKKLEGNLKTKSTALVGTRVTGGTTEEEPELVSASYTLNGDKRTTTEAQLTHASFDPSGNSNAGAIWTAGLGTDKSEKEDKAIDSDEKYFYTMSWKTTFTYDFGGATDAKILNLYFSPQSKASASDGSTDAQGNLVDTSGSLVNGTKNSAKGFRLAIINTTTNDWVVWSPFQGTTLDCNTDVGEEPNKHKPASRYVTGSTATTDYVTTANGNLIFKDDDTIERITESSGSADRKDCVGQFSVPEDFRESTITLKFVVWFEGEDDNVSDLTTFYSASAVLDFYVRENEVK